jgi:hypothetical protein
MAAKTAGYPSAYPQYASVDFVDVEKQATGFEDDPANIAHEQMRLGFIRQAESLERNIVMVYCQLIARKRLPLRHLVQLHEAARNPCLVQLGSRLLSVKLKDFAQQPLVPQQMLLLWPWWSLSGTGVAAAAAATGRASMLLASTVSCCCLFRAAAVVCPVSCLQESVWAAECPAGAHCSGGSADCDAQWCEGICDDQPMGDHAGAFLLVYAVASAQCWQRHGRRCA